MSKLVYSFLASLDGYISDDAGRFDWAYPGDEVMDFINESERGVGTYLYGRTMYEMMTGWENDPDLAAASAPNAEFARAWQAAQKIVFSRTLESVSTARTRIERSFDPELVRFLKAEAGHDLGISGAGVAAAAWRADLVDECAIYVAPMLAGAASGCSPTGCGTRFGCSTSGASATAWSTCGTPSATEGPPRRPGPEAAGPHGKGPVPGRTTAR